MSRSERVGRLHVITDVLLQSGYSHAELAEQALEGGADTIQYREKRPLTAADLQRTAAEILAIVREYGARLIVNDRIDIAAAIAADGVHLGRCDLSPSVARRILGEKALVGGTANSYEEALRVAEEPVDYLGVGPVFGTSSKERAAPALGLGELERIVRAVDKPVIAIGGIDAERVARVLSVGAYGVAVLSAVVAGGKPLRETEQIRAALDRWSS